MSAPRAQPPAAAAAGGSTLSLVVVWAIVGIPAAWGVAQTVIKSLALFR